MAKKKDKPKGDKPKGDKPKKKKKLRKVKKDKRGKVIRDKEMHKKHKGMHQCEKCHTYVVAKEDDLCSRHEYYVEALETLKKNSAFSRKIGAILNKK